MFQALFNSLSGLFSFSRSLDTVSNNVANMNTPGFRGSDSFFENVGGEHGTRISGQGLRTAAGDVRQTGNATDVAIDGGGFFILQDASGRLHYTRAGQFIFDDNGWLVDSVSRFNVMAIGTDGQLSPITMEGNRTLPAQATTRLTTTGNVAVSASTYEMGPITVYGATGATQTVKIKLTSNSAQRARSFLVTVTDASGAQIGSGEIRFSTTGFLEPGFNTVNLSVPIQGTTQAITLDFGAPGTSQGLTSLSGVSSNGTATADGRGQLGITTVSFDESGVLQFRYSSTETRQGQQLALASFISESALELQNGRLISNADALRSEIGRARTSVFGKVQGGSLEMSNIDLTQEFADMLIIQRGYQASSRVMTVSNEMIEQLYNSTRGG
jgi:flagellar hook protein FlgE